LEIFHNLKNWLVLINLIDVTIFYKNEFKSNDIYSYFIKILIKY